VPFSDTVPLTITALAPRLLQGTLSTEDAQRIAAAAHAIADPIEQAAVCGIALVAIHDQRETNRGLRLLQTRVLELTPAAMSGPQEGARDVVLWARFARVVATLYSEKPSLDLETESEELITQLSHYTEVEAVPLQLYMTRHLLGASEATASANLAARLDALADIALERLSAASADARQHSEYAREEWLAERAVVAVMHATRGSCTLDEAQAQIARVAPSGTASAYKRHRSQASIEGLRGATEAESRALTAFRASLLPGAAMPWLSYLRQAAEFENRRGDFVAAEAHTSEGLALAARAEAHPPLVSTMNFVQAIARWGQGHYRAALSGFDEAIRLAIPQHAEIIIAVRALLSAVESWWRDRPAACAGLALGLSIFRKKSGYTFISFSPSTAAEVCAHALEAGIESEFVTEAIRRRGLLPPWQYLKAWPWALRINTFGGFRCELPDAGAKSRNKPARRPLNLLQWLAHAGPRGAERRNLIRALWPGEAIEPQVAAFEMALARLRKMLPDESLIIAEKGYVRLDASRVWVDAWAFKALADGYIATPPVDADLALRVHETARLANALCAGRYLDGADESTYIRLEAEQLRERYVSLQIQITHALLAVDQSAASTLLMQAVEREPYSERLYRELMESQRQAGEYAEVMRTYRRCQHAISTAYGVSLSPATVAIVELLPRAET
jgi:DNA-binding SARP family transcriptional activator